MDTDVITLNECKMMDHMCICIIVLDTIHGSHMVYQLMA